ncbi:ABC-2 family transporter protein (macronuclear) [Tetrahymena thermophila SB210]|uniref:ABC-2 family transporter protein n=1 Tax=Tetrahymena thermophila (strain SB210) TaxID=312017 RepID=Q22MN2_TETTS|nr:ABC-2 family transporter protein [Tetrahymena thermophila SB210]EAR86538.2 ABC-2 family transporter protein [Tetrahymena thermophila SB210]|eukprot:XP_976988.2 ABC-2 family transporter protein [Tetrahymena thermophila SB210]
MNKTHSEEYINNSNLLDFTFKNLKYSIQTSKGTQEIIKGVDGIFPNSQVTAILGSSGAGKTTLLNILSKRIANSKKSQLEGEVLVNGKPYTADTFSTFANYVMQDDLLTETMTVRECLQFAVNLKNKGAKTNKNEIVNDVITQLKLEKCQNTQIGGQFVKGISGGERKRTSIGFELICDPQSLFLDEPTSGLDSFTAYILMDRLRNFAHKKNRTVVLTIHQPSADIWSMLDRIILMVDGKFIYQGEGGNSIQNYFSKQGFKCPVLTNPADYYMSIMDQEKKINQINCPIYYKNYDKLIKENVLSEIKFSSQVEFNPSTSQVPTYMQFYYIVKRTILIQTRSPILFKAKLGQVISLAIFLGLIYYQLPNGQDDPYNVVDVRNKNGFLFFLSTGAFLESMNAACLSIPIERQVFLREENSKLYKIFPYYFAKLFVDLIADFIIPIIFCAIAYWMIGLRNDISAFLFFVLVMIVLQFTGIAAGYFEGCLFKDPNLAFGVAQLIAMPFFPFSGYYKNSGDLASWISWVQYLSPFNYAYQAFVRNEYEETYFIPNPIQSENIEFTKWEAVGYLALMFLGYLILGFYFLYRSKKNLQ